MKILFVDEDRPDLESLKQRLIREGFDVVEAEDGKSAMAVMLQKKASELMLLEVGLPEANGVGTLKDTQKEIPNLPVIIIAASTSVDQAVEALKDGAFDYVAKPLKMDELAITVKRALEGLHLRVHKARKSVQGLVGLSNGIEEVRSLIETVSHLQVMVILVQGESGTGKDLVAKAIHAKSSRAEKPFAKITCTGLQELFLEGELFGHKNGSFPDAKELKKGLFELAQGGTILLTEVGDMGLALQAKLLRVLEEKAFTPIGSNDDIPVDVRVIASTSRNLKQLVKEKKFREDLYYRLSTITIDVPPLRGRREDVAPLAKHFLKHFSGEFRKEEVGISKQAVLLLEGYDWPGNVEELKSVIERAVLLGARPAITPDDILLGRPSAPHDHARRLVSLPTTGIKFDDFEKDLVMQALERTGGDPAQAGQLLGMTPEGIHFRMKQHGLIGPYTGS
jgi:two-component system, NtrC family, response regulator AtoC